MNNPLPLGTQVTFRDQDGWLQGRTFIKPFRYDVMVRDGVKTIVFPNRDREDFQLVEEER